MLIAIIIIGCLLIVGGVSGLLLSLIMFGDIGIAAAIGSMSGLVAGVAIVLIGIKMRAICGQLVQRRITN